MPLSATEKEWETRKKRIDTRLSALGWTIVRYKPTQPVSTLTKHAVEEFPTENGPADYVLFVAGKPLAVLEAKKLTVGPQNVLTQAERYSKGFKDSPFKFNSFKVPFLYATNGEVFWFHDVRIEGSRSRKLASFHSPSALSEMFDRDHEKDCDWFSTPNDHPRLRPYQKEANASVEKAISAKKRLMMLAMATGTGKTFTLVNQVYRLMKSGAARRVLFLVDRRALAAQAVRAFASFEPEKGLKFDRIYEVYSQRFKREDIEEDGEKFDPKVLPSAYLTAPKAKHAFVYVCTVQRMAINLFGREASFSVGDDEGDDEAEPLDIPIHAFDCVIADECHRGYTAREVSTYRNTLDYFDSVRIGLTATPAPHTLALFDEIVFRYDYRRAVQEGYLVDYDAVTIKSNVRMSGVFLKEGEHVGVVDTKSGIEKMDVLEDERDFDASEIEKKITSPDSNIKIVNEIKKYALEHEQRYGRFPKTLIFAAHDMPHISHADTIVNICRDAFGRGDVFVQKITGRVDRPLQRIREFRNRQNPGIVVTVDMLSTGVDIPDLEYIVFLRPVKSRILFEQMLGRGTRKGERHPDKSHFTVFDCFDGTLLEYFKNAVAITSEPPESESRSIAEIIEAIWQNSDRDYNVRCLIRRLHRIDKEMSAEARTLFAAFIPEGDIGQWAKSLPKRVKDEFTATMKVLRNPAFQDLLVNYPRADRHFLKAIESQDTVSSQWLIRDGTGKEYKPSDYLEAFAQFVKENPAQVEAIRILLNRPQDWSTAALTELKQKLSTTTEHFTVETLQRAHQVHYQKALVDIISMVKHAAKDAEPLLTAEERVERAVQKIMTGKNLSADQSKWMERIRAHLVINLSIDRDDFEFLPVFVREGGWNAANNAFGSKLAETLLALNAEVAA